MNLRTGRSDRTQNPDLARTFGKGGSIFMQGLNPCAVRTKRFFVSSFEDKERGNQTVSSLFMVEVTGLEPAASCSQTKKYRFFASFRVLFGAFLSEPRAFSCHKVHISHVVRSRKWSNLWSDLKSHIINPISKEPQALPEVAFLLLLLYHKTADISSPLTVKYLHRCNQR